MPRSIKAGTAYARSALAGALLLSVSLTGAAQVPALKLGAAKVSFSEEFSNIGWIRELSDGTLLVIDTKDQLIKLLDPRSPQVRLISRKGQGPGEFTAPLGLFALRGDTTLVHDGSGARLYFNGTTWLRTDPILPRYIGPYGADTLGHLLFKPAITLVYPPQPGSYPDSQVVVLAPLDMSRMDTIARIHVRTQVRRPNPNAGPAQTTTINGQSVTIPPPPFINSPAPMLAGEQVDISPDGWVAVVFQQPYHVEWRSPAGTWTRGPALPVARVAVDDRQRRAHLEWQASEAGVELRDTTPLSLPGWPATLPAFVNTTRTRTSMARAMPDGRIMVQRTLNALAPGTNYDIIDRTGKLSATLAIAADQRVIAFGKGMIYTATQDADALQRIRGYAWPP